MARKNLLQGLMEGGPARSDEHAALPRYERGAIGAVSKSIDDLKRRAIIDVHPDMIDNAGLKDRLDEDAEGLAALTESIRDYGQQVPVLLRHSPNHEGRYDVVYGRRRVAALKALRQPVKAMVRELNDRDLVIAQGQENSARKDLSFVEKALFAQQMVKAGYDRKIVCDALSIDKTVISRMLTVADMLPLKLIQTIGSAPSIGRDRWLALVQRARGADMATLLHAARGERSDERFEAVFAAAAPVRAPVAGPRKLTGHDGQPLGEARKGKTKTVIELSGEGREFGEWLADHLDEVHRSWLESNS
ncbi:plasmid partitioning protein RepB [uncultured Paracoccus sp.]|uniref:plasmid partitioning protein RepB n=1 Tax=uncultured Paracoccus sp. TaxID=189685 RepID=UPI00261FCB98|nr:plasmid partitioning protein RepB [uncultured Paracoccus sp.]